MQIEGMSSASPAVNPVLMGGSDGSTLRPLKTSSNGTVAVSPAVASSGPLTDRSGTVTLGGTAQSVAAANTLRSYLLLQNLSDTVMYVSLTGTASAGAGSVLVAANGGSFIMELGFISTQELSLFCATTGKAFTCWEA